MSNYEANPVGFLYERYQSSGVSPIYEVRLIRGQAHAPIFEVISPPAHPTSELSNLRLCWCCRPSYESLRETQ